MKSEITIPDKAYLEKMSNVVSLFLPKYTELVEQLKSGNAVSMKDIKNLMKDLGDITTMFGYDEKTGEYEFPIQEEIEYVLSDISRFTD